MNRVNNPRTKKRIYAYEEYHDQEGNRKLRSISQKRIENYDPADLIFSSKTPTEIKERQWAYEEGIIGIGDKTGSLDYLETIEWGKMGGRPRKWPDNNNAERMRFKRTEQKLAKGIPLSGEELTLINKYGSLGRPMKAIERKRLSRYRKKPK